MSGTYHQTLGRPGVQAFLWTQFLGAFNDNVFKIVVSFLAMEALGQVNGVAIVGAVFIVPFLLFSGYAGQIADIHSKRQVLVWMKGLEIVAMALAIPALLTGNITALLSVLLLMTTQSTFFSPAKYGIVPEMLPEGDLSRAILRDQRSDERFQRPQRLDQGLDHRADDFDGNGRVRMIFAQNPSPNREDTNMMRSRPLELPRVIQKKSKQINE